MISAASNRTTVSDFFADFHTFTAGDWVDTNDEGTGAVAVKTSAGSCGGWLSVATAGAANDYHVISSATVFEFLAGRPLFAEWRIQVTEAAAHSAHWFVGLTDTLTGGFLADSTGLPPASYRGAVLYKPAGASVICVESANGSAKSTTPNVATFTSGGIITLGLHFDPGDANAARVQFYVNGAGVYQNTALNRDDNVRRHLIALSGMTPMALTFGIKASTSAAETMLVDYVQASVSR